MAAKKLKDSDLPASEILTRSLELWGPDGEHWCTGNLQRGSIINRSYCLYGGVSKIALGKVAYADGSVEEHEALPNYQKALGYIKRRLPAHSHGIINFNDSMADGFKDVKKVVCAALKDALADEAKEAGNAD
jgi:hypothetical protein